MFPLLKKVIIIVLSAAALYLLFSGSGNVSLGPGIMAPEDPIQTKISDAESFEFKGFKITPLADYMVEAKLLSTRRYRGKSNDALLSPVDFALGWGAMSDESVTSHFEISQSGRFFYWRTSSEPPIPLKELKRSCANTHLIPATERVRSSILAMKPGTIVSLNGQLVKVTAPDGWKWTSSLTRSDTGNGACEIIFVEDAYTTRSQ